MSKSAWFALSLILFASPVHAKPQQTHGTRHGKPYLEVTDTKVITGTVVAINKKNRHVKIRTEAGDTLSVYAGDQVKNLPQIEVNDVVTIDVKERATIEVAPNGTDKEKEEGKDGEEVSTKGAKEGERPQGTITKNVRKTATITAIDKAAGTVTVQTKEGNSYQAKPKRKETLDQLKVGDVVIFKAMRTTAVSVKKAAAK